MKGLGIVGIESQSTGCYTLIAEHLPRDLDIINYDRISLNKKMTG